MTMPDERTRSIVCAGAFLIEVARDKRLPLDVRQAAVFVARHFPTTSDISWMASPDSARFLSGPPLIIPSGDDMKEWLNGFPKGPLTSTMHLAYPVDESPKNRKRSTHNRTKPATSDPK